MKADEVLIAHHDILRGLLRDLAQTTAAQADLRRRLRDDLLRELEVHTQIEDELFYPAVCGVSPLLSVAHAEHRQIDDQLATVMHMDVDDPDLLIEVRMLEGTVGHHAMEEEERMFPQSHALGEERLEELGAQLRTRQRELAESGACGSSSGSSGRCSGSCDPAADRRRRHAAAGSARVPVEFPDGSTEESAAVSGAVKQ